MSDQVRNRVTAAVENHSVKDHYESWPFPDCSVDGREGMILLKYLQQWLTTDSDHNKRVIDIGCGTGHGTLAIARHFPAVNFVGIDLSSNSIEIATRTAREQGIKNTEFYCHDITKKDKPQFDPFDVVISTGVLHHIVDHEAAFNTIVNHLSKNGHLVLWLYGAYGRLRHNLNQEFLRVISGRERKLDRHRVAKAFIESFGDSQVTNSGFYSPVGSGSEGISWLLDHDQWLADQMIPPYEHPFTMTQILELFESQNICLHRWLGVSTDLSQQTDSNYLNERFRSLSEREQLIAIDYLIKPEYYFVIGKRKSIRED